MKKLIFVLLMIAFFVGFVSAGATMPFGENHEVLAEYNVHEGIVTQSTDIGLPIIASIEAVTGDKITLKPQFRMIEIMKSECSCGFTERIIIHGFK